MGKNGNEKMAAKICLRMYAAVMNNSTGLGLHSKDTLVHMLHIRICMVRGPVRRFTMANRMHRTI